MPDVDIDRLHDAARRRAGVVDPVPEAFEANLELLVDSINAEAALNPSGLQATVHALTAALGKRMAVSHWVHEHPEIDSESIDAPLFLTGLPRSGTTYFQYLFDADPTMRMLRTWEGDRPCPPPGFDPAAAEARRAQAVERDEQLRNDPFHAEIAKRHLTDPDGPQECLALLDQTFANAGAYWQYSVPTYFDELSTSVDLRRCYERHKLTLKLLQWRAEPRRWVVKWPCHLVALPEILDVYPDARFVVTHRDPVQALASNASLTHLLRSQTADDVDPHVIGQQMKDMILRYIERLVEFDEVHAGSGRVVHVDYRRVVDDPATVMAEVFAALDLDMAPSVREHIGRWRRENPPGKRGTHEYALADYGLDARDVAEQYAFYVDRFAIPSEATFAR